LGNECIPVHNEEETTEQIEKINNNGCGSDRHMTTYHPHIYIYIIYTVLLHNQEFFTKFLNIGQYSHTKSPSLRFDNLSMKLVSTRISLFNLSSEVVVMREESTNQNRRSQKIFGRNYVRHPQAKPWGCRT
ncbi:hypothetical protein L9F63_008424, partial [Diploptera punctata]